jgi:alkylresorcinol/alkylpyrone synthase
VATSPNQQSGTAVVRSVATALCPSVPQSDVRELAVQLFPSLADSRYLKIFDNAGIDHRSLAQPVDWYGQHHTQAERFALAVALGVTLATDAATQALAGAGVTAAEVDAVVVVSTTVVRSPALDAALVASLGLRSDVRRVPVAGMASLGGAAGLALGADLVAAGHACVLVVAVEMNTLMFTPGDDSPEALVTMALFSDGAAAVVLGAGRHEPGGLGPSGEPTDTAAPAPAGSGQLRVVASVADLVPDSLGVMGFDVDDDGLHWRLAANVPDVALANTARSVDAALAVAGWDRSDVDHLLLHPGGVKVLAACAEALGVGMEALETSLGVLRDVGNMSGVTVLMVLQRHLAAGPPPGRAMLTAMGPGFGFEHVLLEPWGLRPLAASATH